MYTSDNIYDCIDAAKMNKKEFSKISKIALNTLRSINLGVASYDSFTKAKAALDNMGVKYTGGKKKKIVDRRGEKKMQGMSDNVSAKIDRLKIHNPFSVMRFKVIF